MSNKIQDPRFKPFQKIALAWFRPYEEGEDLPAGISISDADKAKGSPKVGDMIGTNPNDPTDFWLVERDTFKETYAPAPE